MAQLYGTCRQVVSATGIAASSHTYIALFVVQVCNSFSPVCVLVLSVLFGFDAQRV